MLSNKDDKVGSVVQLSLFRYQPLRNAGIQDLIIFALLCVRLLEVRSKMGWF